MGRLTRRVRWRWLLPLSVVAAALALVASGGSSPRAADPPYQSVVLISWDGVRRDVLYEMMHWQPAAETPVACPSKLFEPRMPTLCGDYWTCLPTICRFQIVDSRVVPGKPMTRVQHAAMLSGEPPEVTGIYTNNGGGRMTQGISIYERLYDKLGSSFRMAHVGMYKYTISGILSWARELGILDEDNIAGRGGPDKFTGVATNENFLPYLEQFAGERFFAFEHQKGVDWCGHNIGDSSIQYREALMQTDTRLQEVLDKLVELNIDDTTLVLIATDHGFEGNVHLGRRRQSVTRTWIASSLPKLECYPRATVLDVVPTILDALGIDPSTNYPELTGRSLIDWDRTGECTAPTCGNGEVEPGEDCDGTDLGGASCTSLELGVGELACNPDDCMFDYADCPDEVGEGELKISGAGTDNSFVTLNVRDREGSGPEFDPAIHDFTMEVHHNGELLWTATAPAGAETWQVRRNSISWSAERGENPAALVSARFTTPIRRLTLKSQATHTVFPAMTAVDQVDVKLFMGTRRFDFTAPCQADNMGNATCRYDRPEL